jgi:hypothetical protein
MSYRFIDCTGLPLDATIGKHDVLSDPATPPPTIPARRASPPTIHTPQQHAVIVRNMLSRALMRGDMHRQEALKALESWAEVEKALPATQAQGEGI